jgi:hypothetical protein
LSLRGYHSWDGDQAYRLPLLLHRQSPVRYQNDPFVRALDQFNPHIGYLSLLGAASRVVGLSAALAGLFALTFCLTCVGLDRLAQSIWPRSGPGVGLVAVVLVLLALAGNLGTNALFEPILVERLIALSLGWIGLAELVGGVPRSWWSVTGLIGLATVIHPSVGLQLALLLGAALMGWAVVPSAAMSPRRAMTAVGGLALALVPGQALVAGQSGFLFRGLPTEEYRLLVAAIQSPQHMLPHLWRWPQWAAFACYPALAFLAVVGWGLERREPWSWNAPRVRFGVLLGLNLAGLAAAWLAIEVVQDVRVTVFQPFRMATVARGLMLVLIAGRAMALARGRATLSWCRLGLLLVGLTGDWTLIAATMAETAYSVAARFAPHWSWGAGGLAFAAGWSLAATHDTHSGHVALLLALLGGAGLGPLVAWTFRQASVARLCRLTACAWVVPIAAALVAVVPTVRQALGQGRAEAVLSHCRFAEVPVGDLERLATWCREHTPQEARFIGPPGPKTFRLRSRRALAFNLAGSPYHAEGLADWAARYRDHIRFEGTTAGLAHLYHYARVPLERRYDEMSDEQRAALARRQGAEYVIAPRSPEARPVDRGKGPLELLHVEGRYAIYRVRTIAVASAGTG